MKYKKIKGSIAIEAHLALIFCMINDHSKKKTEKD